MTKSKETSKPKEEGVNLKVRALSGAEAGQVAVEPALFGAEVIPHLVHATVVWQRAKARAGTHQALTRTLKEGGKKKPFKQKHTGRARAGSSVSPLWVGGASIHGPLPRSYETRVSKRTRKQALSSVLTERAENDAIVVVDSFEMKQQKTKQAAQSFKSLGLQGKSVLVVMQENELGFSKALRNLEKVSVLNVRGLNVYDLLRHDVMMCSKSTIELISKGETNSTAK